MTNGNSLSLEEFAARWNSVPFVEEITQAANEVAAGLGETTEPTTGAFYDLLVRTSGNFLRVLGRDKATATDALGQALLWLNGLGKLGELHDAFTAGLPFAGTDTVNALRDACLGELQANYHFFLLNYHCPQWKQRRALANEWLASKSGQAGVKQAWELAGALEEILETYDSGKLLAAHIRANKAAGR